MRQILLTLVAFISFFGFCLGQNQYTSFEDSDAKATELLDNINSQISSAESYSFDFKIKIEYPGSAPQVQEGTLTQQANNYFFSMDDQAIYAFGNTIWTHLKEKNEVMIDDREEEDTNSMLFSPNEMLNFYKSGEYVYAISDDETLSSGATRYSVEFKPLVTQSEYSKIRMSIVEKNGKSKIENVKAFSKDGSRFHIDLLNLKYNISPSSSLFQFDSSKYPDIHIEDIRL